MNDLKSRLISAFWANDAALNGTAALPLNQKRRVALQTFEKIGFPTVRHEEWKYSNVAALTKETFDLTGTSSFIQEDLDPLQIPNLDGNILYFVNGRYRADLSRIVSSPDDLQISTFADAQKNNPDILAQYFAHYADFQDNGFVALNTALASDGVFIQVPANRTVAEPVIARFIVDTRDQNHATQPRNLIVLGQNAELTFAESFRTLGDGKALTNIVTEIVLGRDARMQYYKVQNDGDQAHHIGTTQVQQADNSHFYATTVTLNGSFVRNNLNIVLNGQHCEAFMYGLYIPNGKQHVDNHTLVDHAMPNCYSNELYKGILEDRSVGVFNGKIYVRPDAQKTNAYQSCKNVVTSANASMNTKPQLEIYADDVKCSHGTTTGKLNDEALFYLRSRGIPAAEAKTMLMYAFAEEVLAQIKIEPIRAYLSGIVREKLAM
jgi:Fe-S cluster assembly protein SufD